MFRTVHIGKWFGIDTYIHWSFWVLMLWVLLSEAIAGGWKHGLNALAFLSFTFVCVYLHELGHARAAKSFGIATRDITLLPIGGMARLESMPKEPWSEFVVAIAGPAVNAVIAAVLALVLLIGGGLGEVVNDHPFRLQLLPQLFAVNVILVLFNLLPAFPMDGGRILRAILSMRYGYMRATQIAARVGRYLALVMIVAGFFLNFSLVLVGVFVLVAGFVELFEAKRRAFHEQVAASPFPWDLGQNQDRGDVIDAESVRPLGP